MSGSWLTVISVFWVQAILLPQPPESQGLEASTTMTSYFLIETGFHYVGQAGLELLTSSDSPVLASLASFLLFFLFDIGSCSVD